MIGSYKALDSCFAITDVLIELFEHFNKEWNALLLLEYHLLDERIFYVHYSQPATYCVLICY